MNHITPPQSIEQTGTLIGYARVSTEDQKLDLQRDALIAAGVAQFERDLISERTKAGIAAARKRGYVGGKGRKMKAKDVEAAAQLKATSAYPMRELCRMFNVSESTLYKELQELRQNKEGSLAA